MVKRSSTYMDYDSLNLGNSIFDGFNDQNGLMICGYEWGFSKKDQQEQEQEQEQVNSVKLIEGIEHTFANKARYHGDTANTWRYDNTIKKWFELWGFPLDSQELGGGFEKSIVQTNWADTQGHSIAQGTNKFLLEEHIDNFIKHIIVLKPRVIIFMGRNLIDYLQNPVVLPKFVEVMGEVTKRKQVVQKDSLGTRFKVFFQTFEHCQIICFPHPSGSHGISYEYIELFRLEMTQILSEYKNERGF